MLPSTAIFDLRDCCLSDSERLSQGPAGYAGAKSNTNSADLIVSKLRSGALLPYGESFSAQRISYVLLCVSFAQMSRVAAKRIVARVEQEGTAFYRSICKFIGNAMRSVKFSFGSDAAVSTINGCACPNPTTIFARGLVDEFPNGVAQFTRVMSGEPLIHTSPRAKATTPRGWSVVRGLTFFTAGNRAFFFGHGNLVNSIA